MKKEKPKYQALTTSEFDNLLTLELHKVADQQGGTKHSNWMIQLQEDGLSMLLEIDTTEEGIKEIEHDWENAEIDPADAYMNCKITGLQTIDTLCFLGVTAGGDWETPVFSIFYFDENKDLRAYIPKKGNVFNFIDKAAFGNNQATDYKASLLAYKVKYEDLENYNDRKMLEDIRLHFGIKKGAIVTTVPKLAIPAQKKFRIATEKSDNNYKPMVWEVDDLKDGITFIETVLDDKQCKVTITANL